MRRLVDLSQPVRPGQVTHPGLPAPHCEPFRTREEYQQATGTTFQIDRVTMVGNTGTYLDSPFHRFAEGADLSAVPLAAVADLPTVVVDTRGQRAVDPGLLRRRLPRRPRRRVCGPAPHRRGSRFRHAGVRRRRALPDRRRRSVARRP